MNFKTQCRVFVVQAAFLTVGVLISSLAGCSSGGSESKMTSYSASESKEESAELFTVPQDQLAHVQVVPVEKAPLPRVLRLTGAVAYNASKTTPVFAAIGGPVREILVTPGENVALASRFSQLIAQITRRLAPHTSKLTLRSFSPTNFTSARKISSVMEPLPRPIFRTPNPRACRLKRISNPAKTRFASWVSPILPDSKKMPQKRLLNSRPRSRRRRNRRTPRRPRSIASGGHNASLHHFRHEHRLGARQCLPGRRRLRAVGDSVNITTDAYPDTFHGRISYIAPALDPNTRTLQARIVTENPGDKLKKDMYVTATVNAGAIADALTVPDAAVLRDTENQPFVYVQPSTKQNEFARRLVQLGDSNGGRTQIAGGVKEGERVIGDGSLFLQFKNSLEH